MERICNKCKVPKPLTIDFYATRSDRKIPFQHTCKQCQKELRKIHYINNRQKYIDKSLSWRIESKKEFFNWLKTQKCLDCNISDIRVLSFDHKYDKKFNISKMIGKLKLDSLKEEINKCDIVCLNCHAIRTAKQFNWYAFLQ